MFRIIGGRRRERAPLALWVIALRRLSTTTRTARANDRHENYSHFGLIIVNLIYRSAGVSGKGAEMRRYGAVNILFAPLAEPMHREDQLENAVA